MWCRSDLLILGTTMGVAQLALWENSFQTRTRKGHGYHRLLTIMPQRKWAWDSNFDISDSNGGDIGVVPWDKVCLPVIQLQNYKKHNLRKVPPSFQTKEEKFNTRGLRANLNVWLLSKFSLYLHIRSGAKKNPHFNALFWITQMVLLEYLFPNISSQVA